MCNRYCKYYISLTIVMQYFVILSILSNNVIYSSLKGMLNLSQLEMSNYRYFMVFFNADRKILKIKQETTWSTVDIV